MGVKKLSLVSCLLFLALWGSATAAPPPEALGDFRAGSELDSAVYPIGWAKDGTRVALLTALPWEAADERTWEFSLTDLVTDEVVFTAKLFQPGKDGIAIFWAAHEAKIGEFCEQHGVTRAPMTLYPFPALLGARRNEFYEVTSRVERGVEPNFRYTGVQKLTITLSRNGAKSKEILDKTWPQWFPLAAGVVGYIPNPDQSRLAVVTGLVQRGYEGAPHPRRFLITGARIGEKF